MILTYLPSFAADPSKVETYIDGNLSTTFRNGVYTAIGSGSGLFALAIYENKELISLEFKESSEELEEIKLNTVIEDGENKVVKVFRFANDGTPYMVNLSPEFDSGPDLRIYTNENFEKPNGPDPEGGVISDGEMVLTSYSDANGRSNARYGGITVNKPGRFVVYEADYSLPEGKSPYNVRLINAYYNNGSDSDVSNTMIRMDSTRIYTQNSPGTKDENLKGNRYNKIEKEVEGRKSIYYYFYTDQNKRNFLRLSDEPLKLSIIIDLENNTYDFYCDRELVAGGFRYLPEGVDRYADRSFYIGNLSNDKTNGTLIVDNVQVYEGHFGDSRDFEYSKYIGNKIANVHHTDYPEEFLKHDIYERPTASEIAKHVLKTSHPRLLLNKEKVEEIKNSKDNLIKETRDGIIAYAKSMLNKSVADDGTPYEISNTGSVEELPESRNLMMCLGLSYLLTGDKKYAERAYEEAKLMFEIYSPIDGEKTNTAESNKDYWNSHSCLDVTEIPQILSICYDWMYDAFTPEQRAEITKHVMEKGIDNMYRNYYGMHFPEHSNNHWWRIDNNQGAVCNGSAIFTALAFMEEDAHRCSQIVEAGIRALEITLSNFAPDGGWMESASYWAYTLQFATMAAASLDLLCGTNYGLQNTIGLRNSCLYSLAIEGETGAMSFGDGSGDATNAPFLFYWAKAYEDSKIGAAAKYIKEKNNFDYGVYDLLYYDAEYAGSDDFKVPEFFYYRGTEMVSMRSGNDKGETTYMVMTGGKGASTGHDHLDSGHIILEMNGERVFKDMGAEHYHAAGYFGVNRYLYFRARPEGHNIFVINPTVNAAGYPGQDKDAVSTVISSDADSKTATMDLSAAYARDAKKAQRTISIDENKNAIIEDIIELEDGNHNIYWNWYVTVKHEYQKYKPVEVGDIEIFSDSTGKEYAIVTKISPSGVEKKYKVSFDTDSEYTLKAEELHSEFGGYYDRSILPKTISLHRNNHYTKRLAVQMQGVSGKVILKTTVEIYTE